jgi:hypothetical protein
MTTTEVLHRLTSYEPGRAWDAPVNDPRILQGLKTNDFERNTPFVKQYATTLPRGLNCTASAWGRRSAGTPRS